MKKQGLFILALSLGLLFLASCKTENQTAPEGISLDKPSDTSSVPEADELTVTTSLRLVDGMKMVFIPQGSFYMGSSPEQVAEGIQLCQQHYQPCNRWYYERETPQHKLTLDGFWIDKTEVSNQQFRLCVEAGVCEAPTTCKKGLPTYEDPGKSDHPVVCVDWENANNYCSWAGGRLPSEAEWEFANRGEGSFTYPWGDDFNGTSLNYCDLNCALDYADTAFDDGFLETAPVGSFPTGASWTGVLNMGGNVSEWVNDWFAEYSPTPQSNPSGPVEGEEKLIKGCSWYYHPAYCRGATRASVDPGIKFDYLGFRCADSDGESLIIESVPADPVIDGMIQPGEWDLADRHLFKDGSEIFLLRSDEYLYLAIRALPAEMIAGNVFLQQGDQVSIFHTSAALGTAIYQKAGDTWQKTSDFDWCCRSKIDSEGATAAREEFFARENWLGANSFIGIENELEYQIRLEIPAQALSVNFLRVSNPEAGKIPWPADLVDGSTQSSPGGFPEILDFSLERWGNLETIPWIK
ncbi:MAG: hypothetical protein E4H33_00045 [Anaerolineales bacterium]|nr:MAG: hypothetical protein E4H33_00045 [Anaerolineales bacterium]